MPDKVAGSHTPLESKVDIPGAGAGYASNELVTAAELNDLSDLVNQLRDYVRTGRLPDVGATVLSALGESRTRLNNGVIEVSENGRDWRRLSKHASFDVRDYFAAGRVEGTTDDSPAIEAAIAAASAVIGSPSNTFGVKAAVRMSGTLRRSRPAFVPPGVALYCEGKSEAVMVPLNCEGYDFVIGRPADDLTQSHGPWALGAFNVSGEYTYEYPGTRTPDNYFYDLAQCPSGRLPVGSDGVAGHHDWTVAFKFKFKTANSSTYAPIWGISGGLVTAPIGGTCVQVFYAGSDPGFRIIFRYNGLTYTRYCHFPGGDPVVTDGTRVHLEMSWDNAAHAFRFFVNGVLWNDGAFVPDGTGSGTADTSGFVHYPWEPNLIGMGGSNYLHEEITTQNVAGTMSQYHISWSVRHTANFTPPTTVAADSYTQLLINFDNFFKGCIVGTAMRYGQQNVYIYPAIAETWETPSVSIRNLFLYGGGGIYAPFASALTMEHVTQLGPTDGWRFLHNGYFSHFRNCDVVASNGRSGFDMQGGSYCSVTDCTSSGGIGFSFDSANVFGGGNSVSIHPNNYVGLYYQGGGILDWTGLAMDAEESTSVNYVCSLFLVDPFSFTLRTSTLYNPPNVYATKPIVIAQSTTNNSSIRFISPIFSFPPTSGPMIQVGVVTAPPTAVAQWTNPIILEDPRYYTALGQLTDSPHNVLVPSDVRDAQQARMGSGPPSSGTWRVGNIVWNTAALAVGDPAFWRCDVAGSPGTWHPCAVRAS